MSRVSTSRRPAGTSLLHPGGRDGWVRALGAVLALGSLLLVAYLAHPIRSGFGLPLGPDGPVYSWWTRLAEEAGLDVIRRPGVSAAALALGGILGTKPVETITLLGPLLAMSVGLAAGAQAEALLGHDRVRTAVVTLFAGAFAAYLAPGWLANLLLAVLFMGTVAAFGLAERSWRPVALGGALLAAGGLAHWPFALIGALILAGAVLGLIPDARRRLRSGQPLVATPAARLTLGAAAGTGAGLLAMLPAWATAGPPADTSQDQFLRRAGAFFERLLRMRYRERLVADLPRVAAPLAAGATLGGLSLSTPWWRRQGGRYLGLVAGSWAAVTGLGVVVLFVSGAGPGSRLLSFAFFLPVVAAIGAVSASRRGKRPLHRGMAAVAVAAGLVFLVGSMWSWYRNRPFVRAEELQAARTAAHAVEALPPGTPLVFIVDTTEQASSFHVTRFGNVIRMALPPNRIDDLRIVVGRASDVLAGRPTRQADAEYDRLTELYLEEARPVLDRAAVLVMEVFAAPSFGDARSTGELVAPGLVQVSGPPVGSATTAPPPSGLGPVVLVLWSAAGFLLLLLLGAGWARWGLGGASRMAAAALAPSVGLAVALVGAYAADRLGLSASGASGVAIVAALALAGYVLAFAARDQAVDGTQDA